MFPEQTKNALTKISSKNRKKRVKTGQNPQLALTLDSDISDASPTIWEIFIGSVRNAWYKFSPEGIYPWSSQSIFIPEKPTHFGSASWFRIFFLKLSTLWFNACIFVCNRPNENASNQKRCPNGLLSDRRLVPTRKSWVVSKINFKLLSNRGTSVITQFYRWNPPSVFSRSPKLS